MNILLWLIVGGIVGGLASIVMRANGQRGFFLNVVVGLTGAMFTGWFLSPFLGMSTPTQSAFSRPSLLLSFLGAVILVAVVNLIRHGMTRPMSGRAES